MLNKNQRASLAKLSYKVAEILLAGVVISGFMQPALPIGKMIIGLSAAPFFVLVALAFEVDDDPDERPP